MKKGICIPITEKHQSEAIAAIVRANGEPCDYMELRLDCISGMIDIPALVHAAEKPVIATCRPVRDGGHSPLSDEERLSLLAQASDVGAAFVDIEWDVFARLGWNGAAQVIASYHHFSETPKDLSTLVKKIEALPCDVVKFAVMATSLADNFHVWECMRACSKPVIGLSMGELGEVSRVLALRMGGMLTFGSLEKGKESAPGQLTARDLAELYRVRDITSATKLYAVVGNPIAHSVSPEIHNTAFRELGMDAAYLRFRVDDLPSFLETVEPLALQGLSVTIPHKHAAFEVASERDPLSQNIGAVNTLTRTPTGWKGDNTDCHAAVNAIRHAAARGEILLPGAKALVVGAGGASRAIVAGLVDAGCEVFVMNRTHEKAIELAEAFGAQAISADVVLTAGFQIVANTTSIGMHPHEDATPIDPSIFHEGTVAFDAVYNPRQTRMLREARMRGAEIADGITMFVGQAVGQFEIWTGQKAPVAAMEEVVVRRLTHS